MITITPSSLIIQLKILRATWFTLFFLSLPHSVLSQHASRSSTSSISTSSPLRIQLKILDSFDFSQSSLYFRTLNPRRHCQHPSLLNLVHHYFPPATSTQTRVPTFFPSKSAPTMSPLTSASTNSRQETLAIGATNSEPMTSPTLSQVRSSYYEPIGFPPPWHCVMYHRSTMERISCSLCKGVGHLYNNDGRIRSDQHQNSLPNCALAFDLGNLRGRPTTVPCWVHGRGEGGRCFPLTWFFCCEGETGVSRHLWREPQVGESIIP